MQSGNSNFPMSPANSPLVHSLFVEQFEEHGDFPPPGSDFLIADNGDRLISDSGDNFITD